MHGPSFQEASQGETPAAPPELFDEPHWYACYTRARHEKRVEQLLRERGIESYLPVVWRMQAWKDRMKRVAFPMFPSYVFGRFTLRQLYTVLSTPGVSTIVRANGYPTPIADDELQNVRRFAEALADTGAEVEPRPLLLEGQRVRVVEGPFAGIEGVVEERRGRRRVLVGLSAIGQGLEIDIDARQLEPLPGSDAE